MINGKKLQRFLELRMGNQNNSYGEGGSDQIFHNRKDCRAGKAPLAVVPADGLVFATL